MAIRNLSELARSLPAGARLVGLDVGSKTLGVALSDVSRTIATPAVTLARGRFRDLVAALKAFIAENGVGGIVIGLPVSMSGREGPRAQGVRQFADNLARETALPIAFWDERLSTRAAERALLAADMSRRRRKEVIDKVAAAYILQGALDYLSQGKAIDAAGA